MYILLTVLKHIPEFSYCRYPKTIGYGNQVCVYMYLYIYIYNCTVSPVYLDIEVINKRNCAMCMCMCKVTRNCAPIAFLYENVAAASLRTKGKDGNTYPPATDVTCHHLNKDTDFGKYYKEYIYI